MRAVLVSLIAGSTVLLWAGTASAQASTQEMTQRQEQSLLENTRYCSALVNSMVRDYQAREVEPPARLQLFSFSFSGLLSRFSDRVSPLRSWDQLAAMVDPLVANEPEEARSRIRICWERLYNEPAPADMFDQ